MIVVDSWISEYIAIILKREKFVASPARHYFISYTIDFMLVTCDVKGAEIDASA